MHEQLLSLGRKIEAEKNKNRRVWDHTEGMKLLQSTSEQHHEEIFSLRFEKEGRLRRNVEFRIARNVLLSLKEVRYLYIAGNAAIDGAKEDGVVPFITKLVFVRLSGVQSEFLEVLFDSTLLTRLVFLDVDGYYERHLPEFVSHLSALKILKLRHSFLKSLPHDIGPLEQLQSLEMDHCDELQKLPESFGDLSALNRLEFLGCRDLRSLPESFGHLSALRNLLFESCESLRSLPKSFGHLSELSDLELSFCHGLHTLPESFGNLSALSSLRLFKCTQLTTLPKSFGNLSALTNLKLEDCFQLQTLPESFGLLSALIDLQFTNCDLLYTLPESFGQLSALRNLQFTGCEALHTLPECFGHLSALQHLQFDSCQALCALPRSFGLLTKLEQLQISDCLKLDIFPDSFAELIALRHLSIERVGLTIIPDIIPLLQVLELGFLPFVKELPSWLGEAAAGLRNTSVKTIHVENGTFAVAAERDLDDDEHWHLIRELHGLALERVSSSNLVTECDECGMYPLEWPRYEPSTRFDYSLCPDCFQKSGSNASEYTCVYRPISHPGILCDGCEMDPLEGPRYKSVRTDFNLCHNCFQRRDSNASEYICIDPTVLSADDGTTECLDAILAIDGDDQSPKFHWLGGCHFDGHMQPRVFILQERGILKRLAGNLLGSLEDLNQALEIGLSQTGPDINFRKYHGYDCWKHRAYVKFFLRDLDGARKDAQEALSIRASVAMEEEEESEKEDSAEEESGEAEQSEEEESAGEESGEAEESEEEDSEKEEGSCELDCEEEESEEEDSEKEEGTCELDSEEEESEENDETYYLGKKSVKFLEYELK